MSLKLKICGIRDNLEEVMGLKPDYLGFIFYEKSPRFYNMEALEITEGIKRVGVFVNEELETILKKVGTYNLDMVQLHGDENPQFCEELREEDIEVIKVFRVDETFDFDSVHAFEKVADYYLFDTRTEVYGGSGKRFDWSLLNAYDQHKPFFLSGGLDEESIDSIRLLKTMNIHALDLNSGVEKSPGLKDTEKIGNIIQKLNQLNHEVFSR